MDIRTVLLVIISAFFVPPLAQAQEGLRTVKSNHSVGETTDRLTEILESNGATVFEIINHQEGAASVNLELPATVVVIFGNPKLGTPVMQCAQTTAIDLPQKMLIWEENGEVTVGYNDPKYLKKRHHIKGCDQELNKIGNILEKIARSSAGIN